MKDTGKLLLINLLVLLSFACNEKSPQQTAETAAEATAAAATPALEIRLGKDMVATFKPGDNRTEITFENTTFYALDRKGEKRKYEAANAVVAEIKYSDDGFKLRTADGQLLWKVKIHDDKIKISNNEEGENAFQIKESESGKVKVKLNDAEIGAAKSTKSGVQISAADGSIDIFIDYTTLQKGHAVLAIKEIPVRDRLILFHELIK